MKIVQIKLGLTSKITEELKQKADKLDLSLSQYIKFILIKEVQSFQLSESALKTTIADELQKLSDQLGKRD